MIVRKHHHVKWKPTGRTGILLNLVTGEYFELDETALAIWKLIDGKTPVAGVVKKLAARYSAPSGVVEKDVTRFLSELRKKSLIETIESR